MTGMLASVSNLAEAQLAASCQVDIIDLKQPAHGALGALSVEDVAAIVQALAPTTVISATVGDLPMQPAILLPAVTAMATTGVDYIKIGLFPGGDWQACLNGLAEIASTKDLIGVLFADTQIDLSVIEPLQLAGFRGVMLDTMNKSAGSLRQLMSPDRLRQFVDHARHHALLTGLAGSLRQDDIEALIELQADYLGFRGALCQEHCRTGQLDRQRITAIERRIRCIASAA